MQGGPWPCTARPQSRWSFRRCSAPPTPIRWVFRSGAGAGQSTLKEDNYGVNARPTGWKVFVGWRPVSYFGTELDYLDLGSHTGSSTTLTNVYSLESTAHAPALFMVGYLPLPVPMLDVYGKAGAARLCARESGSSVLNCVNLPTCPVLASPVYDSSIHTRFAYGAGAQVRFGLPALRLEYERIADSDGDRSLLSLDVLLNF
ncbi:MAG: outer membrane beta-barrel protein [Proteobacteria bacterium]|nr:outer membrane beta-barrel protein [Pseudomonadota bacterium]